MITDIIEAKRQASRTMKSTSMASMLGAINKLPECANSDVYQQAFLRFMRPGSIGGFGNVWPRSYDEGSGSKNRATNPDELPRIRRRIGDVGKEVYKLQEELSMVRAEAQSAADQSRRDQEAVLAKMWQLHVQTLKAINGENGSTPSAS